MFALLRTMAGRVFSTKVGIALVGALVVGGGGTALAMTGAHAPLISNFVAPGPAATPTAHSAGSSTATTAAGHDDDATEVPGQDDEDGNAAGCAGTASATGTVASPTAESDDSADSSTATTVAGQDDQAGSEHEGTAGDQDEAECAGSVASVNVAGMSFALSTAHGTITVHVDGNTKFAGGVSGLSGLQVGAQVRVDGNLQTDGTVLARYVEVREAEPTHTPGSGDGSDATRTPEPTQGPGGD